MNMKRFRVWCLLSAVVLGFGTGSARALVLYDGITIQQSKGSEPVDATTGYLLAQQFTTNTAPNRLDTVNLLLFGSGTASVSIYTNDATGAKDLPLSRVSTLTSPASYNPTELSVATFTANGGLSLSGNSTYWVVLQATSGTFNWSYANFDATPLPDFDSTAYGLWYADPPNSYLNNAHFTNVTDFTAPFQMSIEAVPEPSTCVLVALGAGGLALYRRRHAA